MQSNLVNFIQVLRSHSVPVSPAETLDAMRVATRLGYADRNLLRDGLAMTLAKTSEEEAIFLTCFDRFFRQELADVSGADAQDQRADDALGTSENSAADSANTLPAQGCNPVKESTLEMASRESVELQELMSSSLMQSLVNNDRNALTLAISTAGDRVGLQKIEMFTQRGHYTRRMLDEMGEEQLRTAIISLEREGNPALPELQRYRDVLREQIRDHVEREYLLHAEGRTQRFMDDILSKTRLNNIEQVYLARVQEIIRRMARKLATRHAARKPPQKRGQLHMAKTLRMGIANDGVLFNTYWRRTRKEKAQIIAVCDVSGSVAAYAKFLLLFLYSLQDVLPKVRSFAFSSHLGEVSHYFSSHPVEEAIELINRKFGGVTDYGNSFLDFANLALGDINNNTTIIILGDARNNNGDPKLDILQSLYQRSRQVIWLNPESRKAWGTGDSAMLRYQSACHFCAECNNLKQLERIVDQLLKSQR